ncbi:hypothetical protein R3P38DRAFT_1673356 [Favolaschia claudopus]|uniref:Uncharacterized protein n=1 Tax=Favolaschia claudopus TaxID=2862362 RepID=A0AAW0ADZ9_9AGAR
MGSHQHFGIQRLRAPTQKLVDYPSALHTTNHLNAHCHLVYVPNSSPYCMQGWLGRGPRALTLGSRFETALETGTRSLNPHQQPDSYMLGSDCCCDPKPRIQCCSRLLHHMAHMQHVNAFLSPAKNSRLIRSFSSAISASVPGCGLCHWGLPRRNIDRFLGITVHGQYSPCGVHGDFSRSMYTPVRCVLVFVAEAGCTDRVF